MTAKLFFQILLANCFVIICFNLLMLSPELKSYLLASDRRILTGVCLYAFQFLMTALLLGKQRLWLTDPFNVKSTLIGIFAFLIVIGLSALLTSFFDQDAAIGFGNVKWAGFLSIFLFNSLPGALMEEWLFRYFPVRFSYLNRLKIPSNIFYLLIILLFTLIHIPSYLFQYGNHLSSLGNIFVSGIFLLLIYLTTKNVLFTALYHAFCNNPKFPVDSSLNWQYFYASVFIVTVAWPVVELKVFQFLTKKEDKI